MDRTLAEMRALALALIALEHLPTDKQPLYLMKTFRQMLEERRGTCGYRPSYELIIA